MVPDEECSVESVSSSHGLDDDVERNGFGVFYSSGIEPPGRGMNVPKGSQGSPRTNQHSLSSELPILDDEIEKVARVVESFGLDETTREEENIGEFR